MKSNRLPAGGVLYSQEYNALRSDAAASSWLHAHQQLGTLALGTAPTNGQTITLNINGTNVVLTAVGTIGSAAGNVLNPGNAVGFVANVLSLLQNPTVTTSTGVALGTISSANVILVQYAGFALPLGGTTITAYSLNTSTSPPLSSFSASTTVTSGTWTAQTMQLYVEPGTFYIGSTNRQIFLGGSTATFTAPVSHPRIDLVVINAAGSLAIIGGTENASPVAPTYPKNEIVLAEVYHVVGETALYDNDNQQSGQGYVLNDVRPAFYNDLAISQSGAEIYAVDTGSANAYVISLNPAITAYVDGMVISFKAVNANTGSSTLAVNGLTAISILKNNNLALAANDIQANQIVTVAYNASSTSFTMISQTGNTTSGISAYGDGSDGSVTFDGTTTILGMAPSSSIYTLTRDIFLVNCIGNNAVSINTAGYMVFISGTLTQNGTFKFFNNGAAGGNASANTGGTAGVAAPGITVPPGTAGVNGGNGATGNATGGNGNSGLNATNSIGSSGAPLSGSSGGISFDQLPGGNGTSGTVTSSLTRINTAFVARFCAAYISAAWVQFKSNASNATFGGGGGSTGGNGGGTGASGSNGGWVVIFVNNIVSSGNTLFQAKGGTGGNGGNGQNGQSSGNNGGAAGAFGPGGNGGVVVAVYHTLSGSLVTDVTGGANGTSGTPGTGNGSGHTGDAVQSPACTSVAGQLITIVA